MVQQVTKYTCDVTGRVFDTLESAQQSERDTNAIQYLRDRVGLDETDAYDVLTCVQQKPEMFLDGIGQIKLFCSTIKGPIQMDVIAPPGVGKANMEDLFKVILGETHVINKERNNIPGKDTYYIKIKE